MKFRNILLPTLVLSAFGAFTFGAVFASVESSKYDVVLAVGEEPTAEEPATPEEESKWKELYEAAIAKYEEIKNKQIAGTTIGALAGALVGAIVSFVPSMINRSNIRSSLGELRIAKEVVDRSHDELVKFKEELDLKDKKLDKAIEVSEKASLALERVEQRLDKALEDNKILEQENKDLKALILDLFGHSEVLVALGVSEEIFNKYLKK